MAKLVQTLIIPLIALLLTMANTARSQSPSTSFNYTFAGVRPSTLTFQYDAHFTTGNPFLQLIATRPDGDAWYNSIGRVLHTAPVLFKDGGGAQADFQTTFKFIIRPNGDSTPAEGLVFFIAPVGSVPPESSFGGLFGVFPYIGYGPSLFAVEFDTFPNEDWDPNVSSQHVGIDLGLVISSSVVEIPEGLVGKEVTASVSYTAATKSLIVRVDTGSLTRIIQKEYDLGNLLNDRVQVGLAASTGVLAAQHEIISWAFDASIAPADPIIEPVPFPSPPGLTDPEPIIEPVPMPSPPGPTDPEPIIEPVPMPSPPGPTDPEPIIEPVPMPSPPGPTDPEPIIEPVPMPSPPGPTDPEPIIEPVPMPSPPGPTDPEPIIEPVPMPSPPGSTDPEPIIEPVPMPSPPGPTDPEPIIEPVPMPSPPGPTDPEPIIEPVPMPSPPGPTDPEPIIEPVPMPSPPGPTDPEPIIEPVPMPSPPGPTDPEPIIEPVPMPSPPGPTDPEPIIEPVPMPSPPGPTDPEPIIEPVPMPSPPGPMDPIIEPVPDLAVRDNIRQVV